MKRFLFFVVLATTLTLTSCQFDDSDIWSKLNEHEQTIKDHEQRISALEELCKQINTNISSLQTIVKALQNNDYVTGVAPITKDGEIIGYTITFSKSESITIYHGQDGKDGANGKDGYTPQIGVKQDTDDIYYWTLDGEWLLDAKGNKIKAVGTDGKDGQDGTNGSDGHDGANGSNGSNGTDGKDGVTPQLKIENDYWYVSYDNGATWEQLGKATGEDGKDGQDGTNGSDGKDGTNGVIVDIQETTTEVIFILSDGSSIILPKLSNSTNSNVIYFADPVVKSICVANWDTDRDGEISYNEASEVYGMDYLFANNTEIVSFTEFQYFTNISDARFSGCTNLRTIVVPESVIILDFWGCTNLTRFNIPENVISLDFTNVENLRSVVVPASTQDFRFQYCYNLESVVLCDGLTAISTHGFCKCTKLTNITIPASVSLIGSYAFYNCTGIVNIYCKKTTPPTCAEHVFDDEYGNPLSIKIYVPTNSVEAYKTADGWNDYADMIEPYDFEN